MVLYICKIIECIVSLDVADLYHLLALIFVFSCRWSVA